MQRNDCTCSLFTVLSQASPQWEVRAGSRCCYLIIPRVGNELSANMMYSDIPRRPLELPPLACCSQLRLFIHVSVRPHRSVTARPKRGCAAAELASAARAEKRRRGGTCTSWDFRRPRRAHEVLSG